MIGSLVADVGDQVLTSATGLPTSGGNAMAENQSNSRRGVTVGSCRRAERREHIAGEQAHLLEHLVDGVGDEQRGEEAVKARVLERL